MYKNKNIKIISFILIIACVICSFGISMFVYGNDIVAINQTNFPDKNWRAVVSDWYDENGDGFLSTDEISGVTLMSVSGMLIDTCGDDAQISDLTGVEYFTSCKRLRCGGIGLDYVDTSKMPQLVELTCGGNELTSLDLRNNANLEWLNCSSNNFESIDFSRLPKLTKLECYENDLSQLDVSMLSNLETLRCQHNNLTSIDLTSNTALSTINCSYNHFLTLDLSKNTALADVTDFNIGNQTTSAAARIDNNLIFIGMTINNYQNIVSTSLDRIEEVGGMDVTVLGYDGIDFQASCVDEIVDGIDYYYDVGLDDAENMSVHIDVERDFHQVKFYIDSDKQTLIDTVIVNTGGSATAPEIIDTPQCKIFEAWSDDISVVNDDMEVYAIWADDHTFDVIRFENGIVYVNCIKCNDENQQYVFSDLVCLKTTDSGYVKAIDINNDGIINAKDYAMLKRLNK